MGWLATCAVRMALLAECIVGRGEIVNCNSKKRLKGVVQYVFSRAGGARLGLWAYSRL